MLYKMLNLKILTKLFIFSLLLARAPNMLWHDFYNRIYEQQHVFINDKFDFNYFLLKIYQDFTNSYT